MPFLRQVEQFSSTILLNELWCLDKRNFSIN